MELYLTGTSHSVTVAETTKGSDDGSYLITGGLSNDFKLSNADTTLNPSSQVAQAVTWDACSARPAAPTHNGDAPTPVLRSQYEREHVLRRRDQYAQAVLADDASRHAQPVIILLSDGNANTTAGRSGPRASRESHAAQGRSSGRYVGVLDCVRRIHSELGQQLSGRQSTTSRRSPRCNRSHEAPTRTARTDSDPTKFYCIPAARQNCNTADTLAEVFRASAWTSPTRVSFADQ